MKKLKIKPIFENINKALLSAVDLYKSRKEERIKSIIFVYLNQLSIPSAFFWSNSFLF